MDTNALMNESDLFAISRPAPALMKYYLVSSLVLGPLFIFPLIPLYFRYHTLRYSFDSEGISMRWGILFRREINLTYARIQDIHLRSNLIERWLGLARVEVQTASGSAGAEMVLEGLLEFEGIRNYLYARMRGSHGIDNGQSGAGRQRTGGLEGEETIGRLIETLNGVTAEIRALRETLEGRAGDHGDG